MRKECSVKHWLKTQKLKESYSFKAKQMSKKLWRDI